MSNAAFCLGSRIVYWDSILVALAALACFFALYAAWSAVGGKPFLPCVLAPLALLLAYAVSRIMYWSCHQEQFSGLAAALGRPSLGGYCLSGVVIGFVLAVLLLRALRLAPHAGTLLDCSAPALALGLAVLRLGSFFSGTCRGKAILTDPRLQRLPFSYPSLTSSGAAEYRFAAFFVEALLFFLVFLALTALFCRWYPAGKKRRAARGDVFLFFLLLYSAVELVIDSTRNDATYFNFNAFISVAQILGGAAILGVLIEFSRRSVKKYGLKLIHWLCWAGWLLGLAGAGFCEYLVQRHGNWQLRCYSFMSLGILLMIGSAMLLHRRQKR
ncbi:MAG: prolipoprotein diacylglyceryl transferase [Oscillospiraceae bacterium]|nr:prolipoprotein diacylglyceryl transferase [Oscillospiraceae bacterium]